MSCNTTSNSASQQPFEFDEYYVSIKQLLSLKYHICKKYNNKKITDSFLRILFNLIRMNETKYLYPEDIPFKRELLVQLMNICGVNGEYSLVAPSNISKTKIRIAINTTININNLKISAEQLSIANRLYGGASNTMDQIFAEKLYIITTFYNSMGNNNLNLSVPPKLIKDFHFTHELFGTPINITCDNYCSPLSLEKDFGSSGNFFDYTLCDNQLYLANPPFDDVLMLEMAQKLINSLQYCKSPIVVILPVWDIETQVKLQIENYGMPFEAFELLQKYATAHKVLRREECAYYAYSTGKYVNVVASHILLLGEWDNFDKFVEEWKTIKN